MQAECDTRNLGSARVLEKLGFRPEGTLREDCVVDGVVSDSWVYGLLLREWSAPDRRRGTAPVEGDGASGDVGCDSDAAASANASEDEQRERDDGQHDEDGPQHGVTPFGWLMLI